MIGRITPDGVVTEFSAGITPGASPYDITAGPDGNVWFVEPGLDRIGRITPAGVVTEFGAGISAGAWPSFITAGADGNVWFTEAGINAVGRITPDGTVTEFSTGITPGAGLQAIVTGPDGNLWFPEQNTGNIVRMLSGVTPTAVELPVMTGDPAVGSVLSATNGTWTYLPVAYDVTWQRCTDALVCTPIAGMTGPTYTVVDADQGSVVRALVYTSNLNGTVTGASNAMTVPAATPPRHPRRRPRPRLLRRRHRRRSWPPTPHQESPRPERSPARARTPDRSWPSGSR